MPAWMYPAIPLAAIYLAVQGYILWDALRRKRRHHKFIADMEEAVK